MHTGTAEIVVGALRGSVLPVILSSGNSDFAYYGVGTAFVIEHDGFLYAISAQHVLRNQGAADDKFRLFTPKKSILVQYDRALLFKAEPAPEYDVLIRRVYSPQVAQLLESGIKPIPSDSTLDREALQYMAELAVVGFPEGGRRYDYENRDFSAQIHAVMCVPPESNVEKLQAARASGPVPATMRGMSGSVVIALTKAGALFAGMVTMASESSGLIHFIPAASIIDYLEEANSSSPGAR